MKTAGGTLYKHVKYGFLIGLVKADMNMSWRTMTAFYLMVSVTSWEDVRAHFHNDISSVLVKHNNLDNLILSTN